MFLCNTDVQNRLPLSLPAYPPLDSPGPCSVSVCPVAKHVIALIYHYIKQIFTKLGDYTAAAICSLSAWYNPTVLAWKKIIFIITTAYVQALWEWNCLSQQQLIWYLICSWPQNHVYHIYWKRGEKKSHFPELLPLPSDGTQWQSLCFGFDSQCFLFLPLHHIFGKPAVLIGDIHVGRAPWSLWVIGVEKNFEILFWFAWKFGIKNLSLLQDYSKQTSASSSCTSSCSSGAWVAPWGSSFVL